MITPFELYLILQLDDIKLSFINVAIVSGICLFIGTLLCPIIFTEFEDHKKAIIRSFIILACLCFFSVCANAFLPSTKSAAVIFIAPKIINSNFIQSDLPEDLKDLHEIFRSWIKEQKDKK